MDDNDNYVIGVDFGSDSVRSLLVNAKTGEEMVSSVSYYTRWAAQKYCNPSENKFRQHPLDYIEGLEYTITDIVSRVPRRVTENIVGIGVDTTGSTVVPVNEAGVPLSMLSEFSDNPNAMFLLWKDHTAIQEAEEITALCKDWVVDYTKYSGGIYSSEWFWSKILHISRIDAKVQKAAYSWVEHCDWIPYLLTGESDMSKMKRSRCAAGHKALWHDTYNGLPSEEFFLALDPILKDVRSRMFNTTYTSDTAAGNLSKNWADKLGLDESVVISVGAFDAHMGAVGADAEPYYLTKIMGTSTCDILVAPIKSNERLVDGICGQVDGSVLPGMLGLEAGQSAFGDIYAWFERLLSWPIYQIIGNSNVIDRNTKDNIISEAISKIIPELSKSAAELPIGSAGELALDWMNGRRTPYANQNLKGVITGINLGSSSPKIFRALAESTCFGSRKIVERFEEEDIPIVGVIAIGGVARKSPFIMQMMSDVLNKPIKVAASEQACALGAAIFASVAAGIYLDMQEAKDALASSFDTTYYPDESNVIIYNQVYEDYKRLSTAMEYHMMENNATNG